MLLVAAVRVLTRSAGTNSTVHVGHCGMASASQCKQRGGYSDAVSPSLQRPRHQASCGGGGTKLVQWVSYIRGSDGVVETLPALGLCKLPYVSLRL